MNRREALFTMGLAAAALVSGRLYCPSTPTNYRTKDRTPRYTETENLLHPNLCARIDNVTDIQKAVEIGAGWVQVYDWHEYMSQENTSFYQTISAAEGNKLNIQVVVAPTKLLSLTEIDKLYTTLLQNHPGIKAVILGNEYDYFDRANTAYIPWENQNPKTMAQFIKDSINIVEILRPDVEIVIGAPYNPDAALEPLVFEMAQIQIPIGQVTYAVHAYQNTDNLNAKLSATRRVLDQYVIPRKIWISELGALGSEIQQENLTQMVDFAFNEGAGNVCLYHASAQDAFTLTGETAEKIFDWSQSHLP